MTMANKSIKKRFWLIFPIILAVIVIFVYKAPSLIYQLQCSASTVCSYRLDMDKVDPSCVQIEDVYERSTCQQEIAVARHDPVLCIPGMPSDHVVSECMNAVIAAAPEDPAVYKKFRDHPELKGIFQYEKYDPESKGMGEEGIEIYFLDIVSGEVKLPINISRRHLFICEEISNTYPRSLCYSKIAAIENDALICKKIPIDPYRDECYLIIAMNKLEPQICKEILDISFETDCYFGIATSKKDESACMMIELPKKKETCLQDVAYRKAGVET